MQNFDKDCFRCLIAYLQSSLYQGLLFFGLVEVLRMHLSLISIREEVKSEIRSGLVEFPLWIMILFMSLYSITSFEFVESSTSYQLGCRSHSPSPAL